jgi:PKD repeat protein
MYKIKDNIMRRNIYLKWGLLFLGIFSINSHLFGQTESEPNDERALADTIMIGGSISGTIDGIPDNDYFTFEITEPGVIEVFVQINNAQVLTDLSLYDVLPPDGDGLVLQGEINEAPDFISLSYLACTPGYYAIRIKRGTGGTANMAPYTLTVNLNTTDIYECNQSTDEATEVSFGASYQAYVNPIFQDEDFYQVTVDQAGTFKFRFTDIDPNMILAFNFFGNGINNVFVTSTSAPPNTEISRDIKVCNPGIYYFKLDRGTGSGSSGNKQYTFTVEYYTDDTFECNDQFSDVSNLIVDCDTIYGSIFPLGDVDYYPFQVSTAGTYDIIVRDLEDIFIEGRVIDEFNTAYSPTISASTAGGSIVIPTVITDPSITYYLVLEDDFFGFSEDLYQVIFPLGNECSIGLPTTCDINLSPSTFSASCNQNDGSVTLTATDGTAPYVYNIQGPANSTITSSSTSQNFSNLPPGDYTAEVVDNDDCTATTTFTINTDGGPVAVDDFDYTINGQIVSFSFNTTLLNGVDSLEWDFGDGVTSNDTFPTHTYTGTGPFTVSLQFWNDCGTDAYQEQVSLQGALPPVASFTADVLSGCAPLTVNFQNNSTNAVNYNWFFNTGDPAFSDALNPPSVVFNTAGNYTVLLVAIGSMGEVDIASVTIEVQAAPVANFSVQLDQSTATFTNLSAPAALIDSYLWSYGNGNGSTVTNPVYTYPQPGNYLVTLVANNICGADTASTLLQVGPSSGQVTVDIGEAEGFQGDEVLVPVILKEGTGTLAGIEGTIDFVTDNVGEIVGFEGSSLASNITLNTDEGRFSVLGNFNNSLTGQDTLFSLRVALIGNPGDMSVMFIDTLNAPTPLSVSLFDNGVIINPDTVSTTNGKITIFEIADIDGQVTFWKDGTGVNLTDVNLNILQTPASPDFTQTTGLDGFYSFNNLDAGNDVTIQCVKDTNFLNGVSTGPLFLIQEYTVGNDPFTSPYQVVASDANCDGDVDIDDVIILQNEIVGLPHPQTCDSWVFVPQSYPIDFQNALLFDDNVLLSDIVGDYTVDFIGVKIGDVLGIANPANFSSDEPQRTFSFDGELKLNVQDQSIAANDMVELTIKSQDFVDIGSMQLALNYAGEYLEFIGFGEEGNILPLSHHFEEDNAIRMSWLDPTVQGLSLDGEEAVLTLQFLALQDISSLQELIWINPNQMVPEAMTTEKDFLTVGLNWRTINDVDYNEKQGYTLYQNIPNPASHSTRIAFYLPQQEQGTLQLIDPLGRVVRKFSGTFNEGFNEIDIKLDGLSAGVYYYQLRTPYFSATRSMTCN